MTRRPTRSGGAPVAAPPVIDALLAGAIDFAGTYPPAGLPLDEALSRYAEARRGPGAWLLGRAVLPAAVIPTLDEALAAHTDPRHPWPVTVVLGEDPLAGAAMVCDTALTRATITSVEFRPRSTESVTLVADALPAGTLVYVETPSGEQLDAWLEHLADIGARAKLRTGGTTADAFPGERTVAQYLAACLRHGVRLKATAGLHHALQGEYPLTYAAGSATTSMIGFLNLLAAAAALVDGGSVEDATDLLGRREAPRLDDEGGVLRWGDVTVSRDAAVRARRQLFDGFGSCSIAEPANDLRRLDLTAA